MQCKTCSSCDFNRSRFRYWEWPIILFGLRPFRCRLCATRKIWHIFAPHSKATATQRGFVGHTIESRTASQAEVYDLLDGVVLGQLDERITGQVDTALGRGQAVGVVIEKAGPNYAEDLKRDGAQLDLGVEYMLEKGQPAIDAPTGWREVEVPGESSAPTSFFTTVAGATYEGRQRIVARCFAGERLMLVREPDNRYDKGAIAVMRSNGEQLGYIPAHVAGDGDPSGLAFRMDRGVEYHCRIKDLTGGGNRSLGVNIEISEFDDFSNDSIGPGTAGGTESARTLNPQTSVPGYEGLGWLVAGMIVVSVVAVVIVYKRP